MIRHDVLGFPARDNALWVEVHGGQSTDVLVFDCGEACLHSKVLGELQGISHLFFSHLHMDHVSGFDTFFRANFDRGERPVHIWGPPGTADILHGRMRGYWWNFTYDHDTPWFVHEVFADRVRHYGFSLSEHFQKSHEEPSTPRLKYLVETGVFTVETIEMYHKGPSLAYVVREKPKRNIDVSKVATLGLKPGAWMKSLKEFDQPTAMIDGELRELGPLRDALLVETPGDSIAYLTDFRLDERATELLIPLIKECTTVICESSYHPNDTELAVRNAHMTSVQAAELCRLANVGQLVLFHLSSRYTADQWREMIATAQKVFPRTTVAPHWTI